MLPMNPQKQEFNTHYDYAHSILSQQIWLEFKQQFYLTSLIQFMHTNYLPSSLSCI